MHLSRRGSGVNALHVQIWVEAGLESDTLTDSAAGALPVDFSGCTAVISRFLTFEVALTYYSKST